MEPIRPMLWTCLKHYSAKDLASDVVSGIIVAVIALPLSIALALASGVGPEEGLYTAIIAGFLISAFGGSKVQIAGPTAAFATIVAGIVASAGLSGLMVTLTGNNLFTVTDLVEGNPQRIFLSTSYYPIMRFVKLGVKLDF